MPKTYPDQVYLIDPATFPDGAELTVHRVDFIDANDDGFISVFFGDTVDNATLSGAWSNDVIRVKLADGTLQDITGITVFLSDGRALFTPSDGSALRDATYVETLDLGFDNPGYFSTDHLAPICFTAGTMVTGADGAERLIDDLQPGDLLQVVTHGTPESRPLRWIGQRRITGAELAADPRMRPVRITAGALGQGLPRRDLVVSRQHRVMTNSRIAQRMFGQAQVLLPATRLTELPGIFTDDSLTEVTYIHLLFDDHEILSTEGAQTESMYTGPEAMKSVTPEARAEILTLFPELSVPGVRHEPARIFPKSHAQRRLIQRHLKNAAPLWQDSAPA